MYLCSPGTAFMKYYRCFVVATTMIETQKSDNDSPLALKPKRCRDA